MPPDWVTRLGLCRRPYCAESTRSHPNSEVKLRKARSVLGWGTAWEALRVLLAFCGGRRRPRAMRRSDPALRRSPRFVAAVFESTLDCNVSTYCYYAGDDVAPVGWRSVRLVGGSVACPPLAQKAEA